MDSGSEVNGVELLEFWVSVHGRLNEAQRQRFMLREEVTQLLRVHRGAVTAALMRSRRLAEALVSAQAMEWWFLGEECEEDGLAHCVRCKPHSFPPTVFMTRGSSSAFHASDRCRALRRGQLRVEDRGGTAADIELVHVQIALGSGRMPCVVCLSGAVPRRP